MENNPKKSKAFIITFILILLLLVGGYYIYKNSAKVFDAKGSTSLSKIFSPLFGTSKDKGLNVIDENPDGINNKNNCTINTGGKMIGTVITDAQGNRMVQTEAGEDLKNGDSVYIASFNSKCQPIVKKTVPGDPNKSLVFGVMGEDVLTGGTGNTYIGQSLAGSYDGSDINISSYLDSIFGNGSLSGQFGLGNSNNGFNLNPINIPGYGSIYNNLQKCTLPKTLNLITKNCEVPPNCKAPLEYSYILKSCVNAPTPEFCLINPTDIKCPTYPPSEEFCKIHPTYPTCTKKEVKCNLPQILNPISNKCEMPVKKCITPLEYSFILKSCVNAPTPEFCLINPTNIACPTYPPTDAFCKANPTYLTCPKPLPVCTFPQVLNPATKTCETPEDKTCDNGATDYPNCKTKDGKCVEAGMTNPPLCDTNAETKKNRCLLIEQNPLTFTQEEKAKLAVLLRKFYLVSSGLKTSDDITTTYSEIEQQSNFISQTKELTKQCYAQVDPIMNTYGWTRHGNPWCNDKNTENPRCVTNGGGSFPYTSDYKGYSENWTPKIDIEMPATERVLNIW